MTNSNNKPFAAKAALIFAGGDKYGMGGAQSDAQEDIRIGLVSAHRDGVRSGLRDGRLWAIIALEYWIKGVRVSLDAAAKSLADMKDGLA